ALRVLQRSGRRGPDRCFFALDHSHPADDTSPSPASTNPHRIMQMTVDQLSRTAEAIRVSSEGGARAMGVGVPPPSTPQQPSPKKPVHMSGRELLWEKIQRLRATAAMLEVLHGSLPEELPPYASEALWQLVINFKV